MWPWTSDILLKALMPANVKSFIYMVKGTFWTWNWRHFSHDARFWTKEFSVSYLFTRKVICMQVLTNFCVFIIFVGQGAKIFVCNCVSDTRCFSRNIYFPKFFSLTVPLEERYRDFTVFGQGFFCYCWHTMNMSWWYYFQLHNVLLSGMVHFLYLPVWTCNSSDCLCA